MIHDQLIERAVHWLKNTKRCGVVVPEPNTYSDEHPDALGWKMQGAECVVIECKTSRADFLADQKKPFRMNPKYGIGDFRYYLTCPGLLTLEDLPARWGLLEVGNRRVKVIRESERFPLKDRNVKSVTYLYAYLRRASINGDLCKCYSPKWRPPELPSAN